MAVQVLMPALSPTMEEGKLAKWLVKEGDKIASGDVIAEIETDKATMEVEAIDEGRIGKILVIDGTEGVKVNTPIAIILAEGENADAIDQVLNGSKSAPQAANSSPQKQDVVATSSSTVTQATTPTHSTQSGDRVLASPLAKRIAQQNNIDLKAVQGTGPKGRIVKADIDKAISSGTGKAQSQATTPAAQSQSGGSSVVQGMTDAQIKAMYEEGTYDIIPLDGMRKIIAKRLCESKQTIPHFYLSRDVQLDALLKLRSQVNARSPQEGAGAYKISVNDFVIKAMAIALQRVPNANTTWTESGILKHKYSDVGVAVAVEGGLFTPVIRRAETKSIVTISNEMKDYAKRARSKKLLPHEYQGGTTAISNLGMFGITNFQAIVNPPHASILAVGAGEQRPIIKDGALAIGNVMTVTLSVDHRAIDGALGAELLKAFVELIEDPMGMLI
jgi:pyruvate dehydrogenase E2 component (dihydrolipoamide acetyltransferase)